MWLLGACALEIFRFTVATGIYILVHNHILIGLVVRLRSLCLHKCADLTDVALAALGLHCTHLEKIELKGCIQITAKGQ